MSRHLAARRLGLSDVNAVDAYVSEGELDEVVRSRALVRDASGTFTLRATTMAMDVVAELISDGDVVAALGPAESLDVREGSVDTKALQDAAPEAFRA